MTTMKRWISSLMAAVLCLSLAVAPASAYVRVDTTEKVSLTLTYTYDQKAVEGLNISIYKVYDMSDAVRFTVEESFETAYGTDGTDGAQKEMSFTLSDWPIKDEEGNVVFEPAYSSVLFTADGNNNTISSNFSFAAGSWTGTIDGGQDLSTEDSFFSATDYQGALEEGNDWTAGWTRK